MPVHLRALVVIVVLATVVFAIAGQPACAGSSTKADFERRRNLWFGVTFIAFLAHNFWVYIIGTGILLLFAVPLERNRLALFFFLLYAVPAIPEQIPGFGIIDHFFTINYVRLLTLAILLPEFQALLKRGDSRRFGQSIPDLLVAGYLVLNIILQLRDDTLTNTLRLGVFYGFVDIFLPYYVASRSLTTLSRFRDALMALAVGSLVLAAVAVFEYGKHWLLYADVQNALGVTRWGLGGYLGRGESLRAAGSTGHPIVLGYAMAIAVGFFLFLRHSTPKALPRMLGLAALTAGLIAPLSRGPWVGAAAMFLVFIATGPNAGRNFGKLALLGAATLPVLLSTTFGANIVDHLPFVGSVEAENVTYRQRLLEISLEVMMQNPLFGVPNFIELGAMQELRQGQGIIDIVNSFLAVGLASGLVGLSLFSGFFIAVCIGVFRSMRSAGGNETELLLLGRSLLSTLVGILVTIFTVSSISLIPVIYWSVAGLGVGYMRLLSPGHAPAAMAASSRPAGATRSVRY